MYLQAIDRVLLTVLQMFLYQHAPHAQVTYECIEIKWAYLCVGMCSYVMNFYILEDMYILLLFWK